MAEQQTEHKHEYRLIIDNRQHDWPRKFITGDEIKKLAGVPSTYSVWEIVPGPEEDKEIGDHEKVDLGGEHEKRFITGKKHSTEG